MKKISVLNVLGPKPVGGVGTFIIEMNRNIDASKVNYYVIQSSKHKQGDFDLKFKENGKNYLLPELTFKNIVLYYREVKKFYRSMGSQIDIVHVHSPNLASLHFYFAKKNGIDVRILHSHSTKYSTSFLKGIRNRVLIYQSKLLATNFFSASEKSANVYFPKEHKVKKVNIIQNAIDVSQYAFDLSTRNQLRKQNDSENELVIGMVGNLVPVKNHLFILKVMEKLQEQKIKLFIIGEGENKKVIENLIEKRNLKNIVLLGRKNDVHSYYNMFDLLVLPSLFEGFPLVAVEAQTNDLYCLMSDTITKEADITGKAQFLPIEGEEAVMKWVKCILDFNTRKQGRTGGAEALESVVSKGFDIKESSKRLQTLYFKIIGEVKSQ